MNKFYPNHNLIMIIILAIDTLCIFSNTWTCWAVFLIHQYAFVTIMMGFYYQVVQQYQPKLDRLIQKYQMIPTKKNHRQLVYFVPLIISEHFRYVQLKNMINDELLSTYLWILFISNLPTSIYIIAKVVYEPIELAEKCFTMIPWTTQLIICLFIVFLSSISFKMLNSISHRLYCSQLYIKSNLILKWNILSYYEMVHSKSNFMAFRMGSLAKITNITGFKVRFLVNSLSFL